MERRTKREETRSYPAKVSTTTITSVSNQRNPLGQRKHQEIAADAYSKYEPVTSSLGRSPMHYVHPYAMRGLGSES